MRVSSKLPPLGEFIDPLVIKEGISIPDSYGGFNVEWKPLVTVWSKVEALVPSQPDERWDFLQQAVVGRYWVWMRQIVPIKQRMRFCWGERILTPRAAPLKIKSNYSVFLVEEVHE